MDFPRTVYAMRHNKTGKVYVGSSCKPENRIMAHKQALRRGQHPVEDLQSDFNLYGDDFTISHLEVITGFGDRYHEYDWMRKLNSFDRRYGYNYKDRVFTRKKDPRVTYRNDIKDLLREIDDLESLDLIYQIALKMVRRCRSN